MNRSKNTWPAVFLLVSVIVTVLLYYMLFLTKLYIPKDVIVMDQGWSLTSSQGTQQVSIGGRVEGADFDEFYTLERRLPSGRDYSSAALFFQSNHQDVVVSVDGSVIYTQVVSESNPAVIRNNYVYLPVNYQEKILTLSIHSDSPHYYDIVSPVYFGNYNQLHEISNNNSGFRYLFLGAFITAFLFFIVYAIRILRRPSEYNRYFFLGLFFLFSAGISAIYAPTIPQIVAPAYVSLVQSFVLFLAPLPLLIYMNIAASARLRRWMVIPLALEILLLVFSLLVELLDIFPITVVMNFFFVVLVVHFGFAFWHVISLKRAGREPLLPLPALCLLFLVACFDVYAYIWIKPVEDFRLVKAFLPVCCSYIIFRSTARITREKYKGLFKEELNTYVADAVSKNYEMLEQRINEMHKISHDLKNHYSMLYHLYAGGRQEEALSYLQNLCNDYVRTLPFCNTGNVVVDSIINDKLSAAQALHADIQQMVKLPPSLPFSDRDLCSILVNVLDNALDALALQEHGTLELSIFYEDQQLFIMCKNSKVGETIERDGRFLTTKSSKMIHGYGISIIQSTVEKHEGTMHIEYDDTSFEIYISLPLDSPPPVPFSHKRY